MPLVLAALLSTVAASCSTNDDGPLAPQAPAAADSTTSMLFIGGVPRVLVLFDGGVTETTGDGPLTGSFRVLFDDSLGRRVFLPDVRLNDVALVEERDAFGAPVQSRLDVATALPDLAIADTLRLDVRDGGALTPPFTLGVVPSRMLLAADSAVVARDADLVLPFTGRIERLVLTLTDVDGRRLRVQYTFDHYSGLSRVVVPARDLRAMAPGVLLVAANVLDAESRVSASGQPIEVSYQSTQRRAWKLAP